MLFGSRTLQKLIVRFLLEPEATPHFRELLRGTRGGVRPLQKALKQLEDTGLLVSDGRGNRRIVRPNVAHPGWEALRAMVRAFVGPQEVLREAVARIPGIEAAFVFGSTARGEARADSDVDLFVVGDDIPRLELTRSVSESTAVLGREVNLVSYTRDELARRLARGDHFLRTVTRAPKQWLLGDADAFAELYA